MTDTVGTLVAFRVNAMLASSEWGLIPQTNCILVPASSTVQSFYPGLLLASLAHVQCCFFFLTQLLVFTIANSPKSTSSRHANTKSGRNANYSEALDSSFAKSTSHSSINQHGEFPSHVRTSHYLTAVKCLHSIPKGLTNGKGRINWDWPPRFH